MRRFPSTALIAIVALLGGVGVAAAQTTVPNAPPTTQAPTTQAPTTQVPTDQTPHQGTASDGAASGSLSHKLSRSHGVIHPPATGDRGVIKPPPTGSESTPVIPTPGSPGGNPQVQPK